jgi:hypothetical protein
LHASAADIFTAAGVTGIGAARRFVWAAAVSCLLSWPDPAAAQAKPTEPQMKAAFLYNFVKFIEWPDDVLAAGPITVCVIGSPTVAESLRAATQERRGHDRDLAVAQVTSEIVPKNCQLVYVAGTDERGARKWLAALTGSTAFSVSDFTRFAKLGGVANFFVEDGRLRFAVNVDAARRTGLRISSRLLALATIVKDEPAIAP